ncbi:MAG: lytic murein transglycosylase [Alphaproteobacteria bacterium]|nr:lytic murein transglycosylase [Alphaproteobacteria bacterium]
MTKFIQIRLGIVAAVFLVLAGGLAPKPAFAEEFGAWLSALRAEAEEKGIRAEILDAALRDVTPLERVIELDRSQPEFTLTFDDYLSRVVPASRVNKGRQKLAENRALLQEVAKRYGVQPRFLVAFWGIETDFGRLTGGFSVIQALATLAYDGRRSTFFRKELLAALQILNEEHIAPDAMTGSWAGAMGQSQFMPTTFLGFAVDHDGDGRQDIWTSRGDVFASAANYLAKSGWRGDETWGRAVRLPEGFDSALIGLETEKPIGEWQALGVRRANGNDLPKADLQGSIVLAEGSGGPAFLVYRNYRAILTWNRSTFFAVAVGTLADRIAGR